MIRLNKYLADQGVASRREADRLIAEGLVKVNGETVTEMGFKVDPEKDQVELSDKLLERQEKLLYFALNKPIGYTSSVKRTRFDPAIVTDLIKTNERIYPVGRLDKDTSGLLILTNDGTLTYKLTHPKSECEKEYEVRVDGVVTPGAIEKLKKGVRLWGEQTKPAQVKKLGLRTMSIILTEGKNRQVRRICQKVGLPVQSLKRVRIKNLELGDLKLGHYRKLTQREVDSLKA